jgi:predicted RecB family nuclease
MQRFDDRFVLSASDLTAYLECEHLIEQQLAIARQERKRPYAPPDPHAALAQQRGHAFEADQLKLLTEKAGGCQRFSSAPSNTLDGLQAAAQAAIEAMQAGAPLIHQGVFFDGDWQGRPDFLRRVAASSSLGDWSYEVLDIKLSRELAPYMVNQVLLYSRMLTEVQGLEPTVAWIVLGDGRHQPIELGRFQALHRHFATRLVRLTEQPAQATYPEPVAFCDICDFAAECAKRRRADDHLSLVCGAVRARRAALTDAAIPTRRSLGIAPAQTEVPGLRPEVFQTLHYQADLQVRSEDEQRPLQRQLAPRRAEGYAALPDADPADVFFDLEGDPFIGEAGIEYLWGWSDAHDSYAHHWAHDAAAERAALEAFVDEVHAHWLANPRMHVYHYSPHERAKLRSLTVQYATREVVVDELLRSGVFVDLFAVVRAALQVGEESYSLKRLERHYGFERNEHTVREGGGSIVTYESWLDTGDDDLLEAIRAYNAEDCISMRALRDWLAGPMMSAATDEFDVDFVELRTADPVEPPKPPAWMPDVERRVDALMEGLDADPAGDDGAQAERRLLAHLLLYHHREDKPAWWHYFDLRETPVAELIDEADAIAGLVRDHSSPPSPVTKQSLGYRFTFPPQEHRLKPGRLTDPVTGDDYDVKEIGVDYAIVACVNDKPEPQLTALIDSPKINAEPLRNALLGLADRLLAGSGVDGVARRLLRREPPRLRSGSLAPGVEKLVEATLGLDGSVLPVQGPPGTGKTYSGARMIVAALAAGRRVGVSAQSHAAIQNLLSEVEKVAGQQGVGLNGVYKPFAKGAWSGHPIAEITDNKKVKPEHNLVAGTAFLFARPEHLGAFDLLFVDEAGQYSLANAVAVASAAQSLVLLGDPQQLPQVTQAPHPLGSGDSVLEHLLQGADTIPPDRGVLLDESWRMHPEICAFVSERSYEDKLHAKPDCATRRIQAPRLGFDGAGLRTLFAPHRNRSQASPEEAEAIASACTELLAGGTVTDEHGRDRRLTAADILVVAPYNQAVTTLERCVPAGVRIGTVDRFQGQEAPVVFYAMTCSSGADAPRGMDFLLDRNRLNVAISRAQALAVLVLSPSLLDSACPTVGAMALLDGACRFVELATPLPDLHLQSVS